MRDLRFTTAILPITLAALLSQSCAHNLANSRDPQKQNLFPLSGDLPESQASEKFAPKLWSDDGSPLIDSGYMQSQSDFHFARGEAFSFEARHELAIEEFKSVLLYQSDSAPLRIRLATEYVRAGKITPALENAKLAVQLNNQSLDAHMLLAGLYSSMRLFDNAIEHYQSVIDQDPQHAEARLLKGAVYAELQKVPEAIRAFDELIAIKDAEHRYLGYYYKGRMLLEKNPNAKDFTPARRAFIEALELKADFEDAALAVAESYDLEKREPLGVAFLEEFQSKNGAQPSVAQKLAKSYFAAEKYDLALDQMIIIEGFSSGDLAIKLKLAMLMIELKRYNEAEIKLKEILNAVPESDKVQFYLAGVQEELGNVESAIESFSKIPTVSPYFAEAKLHQAYLLRTLKKEDQALKVLQMALDERPDIVQLYTLAASIMDAKGQHKQAVELLQVGNQAIPDQVDILFFLGSMEDKLGNREQTVAHLKRAIEIDSKHVQSLNYLAYTYAEMKTNLVEAEILAKSAVEINPEDGFVIDTLGWVLFQQKKYKEAVTVLELAYAKQPKESIIAEHLGDAYLAHNLPARAKQMYEMALSLAGAEERLPEIRQKISASTEQIDSITRRPASLTDR